MKYVYLFGDGITEGSANQQNILGVTTMEALNNILWKMCHTTNQDKPIELEKPLTHDQKMMMTNSEP